MVSKNSLERRSLDLLTLFVIFFCIMIRFILTLPLTYMFYLLPREIPFEFFQEFLLKFYQDFQDFTRDFYQIPSEILPGVVYGIPPKVPGYL